MSTAIFPRVTPRDFAILETMLADHPAGDESLIAAIRKKLELAQIVFADDLAEDVVTIGSQVAFSIDGGFPRERWLVAAEHYAPGQGHQSLASLRGVGLLGLATGDRVDIDLGNRIEQLELHKVLYQPEAESKARKKPGRMRLVSSRDVDPHPVVRRPDVTPPGDDPGPSAA